MNNISLGRYIPYDTIIHKLDPRTKILAMIMLLVCVFLPIGYIGYAALLILVFALLKVSKIKISSIYKSLESGCRHPFFRPASSGVVDAFRETSHFQLFLGLLLSCLYCRGLSYK